MPRQLTEDQTSLLKLLVEQGPLTVKEILSKAGPRMYYSKVYAILFQLERRELITHAKADFNSLWFIRSGH